MPQRSKALAISGRGQQPQYASHSPVPNVAWSIDSVGWRFNSRTGAPERWAMGTTIVAVMYVARNMTIRSHPAARSTSAARPASCGVGDEPGVDNVASNCPSRPRNRPGGLLQLREQVGELRPVGAEATSDEAYNRARPWAEWLNRCRHSAASRDVCPVALGRDWFSRC